MENVIKAINDLTSVVEENNNLRNSFLIPLLVGLIPSILLIIQNHIIEKRNEKLQLHNNILEVYNVFSDAIMKISKLIHIERFFIVDLGQKRDFIAEGLEAYQYNEKIVRTFNLARMMFNRSNKKLVSNLEEIQELYIEFTNKFSKYIIDGKLFSNADEAWNNIKKIYPDIPLGDIHTMKLNQKANKIMESICITDEVKELQNIYDKLMKNMDYDKYDKYFEKYLRIK